MCFVHFNGIVASWHVDL
jgi:hypothetical protein